MNELIKKLLGGEGKLNLLILEAKQIAEENRDEHFLKFLDAELQGYKDDIPDYRRIKSEIVVNVVDHLGRTIFREEPLDVSAISEKLNFDLTTCLIPDGIGFVEENLSTITGSIGLKPLADPLVNMLNQVFVPSNPGMKIKSAAFRIGKVSLQYILTKVRQEVIIGLQKLIKQEPLLKGDESKSESKESKIKVFVTYAWENEEENDKVISFVNFLREKGFEASMDLKESQESTATNFNQMMIANLQQSDKVIVVLSEKYKDRADKGVGGAGFEFSMIMEDIKTKVNKYIFVTFGKKDLPKVTPFGIAGRDILDLKKDQDEYDFNLLFARLHSITTIKFSEVNESVVQVKVKEVKPFKL
jgi:hypothetical protein